MSRVALVTAALAALAPAALAQEEEGLGPAPTEARAVVARAVEAMGGREQVAKVRTAIMTVIANEQQVRERHTLRVEGRYMHYASRRPSGAGFDVVLAQGQAFLCDRDAQGEATFVEDLSADDAIEGGYERDVLFMPLLLPLLLEQNARMDYRGRNSEGEEVVRALIAPPAGAADAPFVIRLRFDAKTSLLNASMGVVPLGHDKGKKRYCEYADYQPVEGPLPLRLPAQLSDKRGKEDATPRVFRVRWDLNVEVPPAAFLKPKVSAEDG